MKTAVIAIVVLSLAANSPVHGQDPGTGSAQCVLKCVNREAEDTSVARSSFQQVAHRASASASEDTQESCTGETERLLSCVERCQLNKYAILAREANRLLQKYCGDHVDPEKTKKYLADDRQFTKAWSSELEKCPTEADGPEGVCEVAADCVFGSALTSAKNTFSSVYKRDIVTINVFLEKIDYAAFVETTYGEAFPSSCGFLFEPNVPEPTYQPAPYPYEPYPHEQYQLAPYQHNPYQRNYYRRNPYQRNPYKHNPNQRNPY